MKSNKLSKSEFARALKLGHGRVILHLRDHGDKGVEEEIEDAVVNNYVFDQQLEGSRSRWLCNILNVTRRADYYAKYCFEKFAQDELEENQEQQIELSEYFFELGFEEYRQLMLDKFTLLRKLNQWEFSGTLPILNCCGLSGLSHIVESVSLHSDDLNYFDCGTLMNDAVELLGRVEVESRIAELLEKNPRIQIFIDACRKFESYENNESLPHPVRSTLTMEDVLDALNSKEHGKFLYEFRRFGMVASSEEISRLLDRLNVASDPAELRLLFSIFARRALPEVTDLLLQHVESEDERLSKAASRAISQISSSAVHMKSLSMLDSTNSANILRGLELLTKNFESEDVVVVFERLKSLTDLHDLHWAGSDILEIAKFSKDKVLVPCLLWFYENNPDTWCRHHFVELLHEWNELPSEILYESQWDAGLEVRVLARTIRTV